MPQPIPGTALENEAASTANTPKTLTKFTERRGHRRERVKSIAYVAIGTGNGGIVLDVSEGGLSLASAASLRCETSFQIRVRLPGARDWIEVDAEFVWTSESKRQAGVRFAKSGDEAHNLIRGWVASEAPPVQSRLTVPAGKELGIAASSKISGIKGASSAATPATRNSSVLKPVQSAANPGNTVSRQRNSIALAEAVASLPMKKGTNNDKPQRKRSKLLTWLMGSLQSAR